MTRKDSRPHRTDSLPSGYATRGAAGADRPCPRTGLPVHLCECTSYVRDLSAPISAEQYAWCHDTAAEREARKDNDDA